MNKPSQKTIRVLHILRPGIGGAAKHLSLLVQYWSHPNISLSVVSSPLENPAFPKELAPYVEKVWEIPLERTFSLKKDAKAFLALFRLLKKESFDIVHTHASKAGFLGRIAAKCAGVRVCFYTPHGFYFSYKLSFLKKCLYFLIEFVLAPFTERVLCLTPIEVQQARKLYPKKKIILIPNALDIQAFQQAMHSPTKPIPLELVHPDCRWVIMVARLTPPKDPFTAIRAFAPLSQEFPNLRLVFVGEGELYTEAVQLVQELGLSSFIFFLGMRQDVPALLQKSHIALLSSFWEGLPYTLLESLVAGLPVVASDIPGHAQVIRKDAGKLFFPGSVSELVHSIRDILNDPEKAQEMAKQGQKRVQEEYTVPTWIQKFEQFYQKQRKERSEKLTDFVKQDTIKPL